MEAKRCRGLSRSNPYRDALRDLDDRDSYVTVREAAEILNISEDRVCEPAQQGTLRTRWGLVQPALIPGYTY